MCWKLGRENILNSWRTIPLNVRWSLMMHSDLSSCRLSLLSSPFLSIFLSLFLFFSVLIVYTFICRNSCTQCRWRRHLCLQWHGRNLRFTRLTRGSPPSILPYFLFLFKSHCIYSPSLFVFKYFIIITLVFFETCKLYFPFDRTRGRRKHIVTIEEERYVRYYK